MEQADEKSVDEQIAAALRDLPRERWDALAAACARADGASGGWAAPPPEEPDDDAHLWPRLDPEAQALVETLRPIITAGGADGAGVREDLLEADLDELSDLSPSAALRFVAGVLRTGRTSEGMLLEAFESGVMATLVARILEAHED